MKKLKHNQKQVKDYFAFLDQVFETEKKINPGLKKIAGAIVEKKGIPAAFRYLTNQAGLTAEAANQIIKRL